jgi:hypothetical protein
MATNITVEEFFNNIAAEFEKNPNAEIAGFTKFNPAN